MKLAKPISIAVMALSTVVGCADSEKEAQPANSDTMEEATAAPSVPPVPSENMETPPDFSPYKEPIEDKKASTAVGVGVFLQPKIVRWEDLTPLGYDLYEEQEKVLNQFDLESIVDGTPEAQAVEDALQIVNDNAPVVEKLDKSLVKIPGFISPLEYEGDAIKSFLLVPYYGACIHTPPPPSNQIVYVETKEPIEFDNPYDPIWITGKLDVEHTQSDLGSSGYRMKMDRWEVYQQ